MALKPAQRKILNIVNSLHERFNNDPIGWVQENIDFSGLKCSDLTDQQKLIARELYIHKRLAVPAGGGIGKTALAALLCLSHLSTYPYSTIPTTAPSGALLDSILWGEIAFWLKRCRISDIFTLTDGKLGIKHFEKEWYAIARTVPKDKKGNDLNDTLAGFHSPNLLIIVDEASGVPTPVFTALDGAQTDANAMVLLISNPVSTSGYFYDTISDPHGKGSFYHVIYLSSLDSPLVDPQYEQLIISRYGKNSTMYKSKVLGLPISEVDTALILPEDYDKLILHNTESHQGSVVLAIDVAAEGADPTIFLHRRGNSFIKWERYPSNDGTFIYDRALEVYNDFYKNQDFTLIIDGIGVGSGPADTLKRYAPFPVIIWKGSEKAENPNMFTSHRAEGFYKLRNDLSFLHFPVTPPPELKKELVNIRFDYSTGMIDIEPKKKLAMRLGHSPDNADVTMMANVISTIITQRTHFVPAPSTKTMSQLLLQTNNRAHLQESRYGRFLRPHH